MRSRGAPVAGGRTGNVNPLICIGGKGEGWEGGGKKRVRLLFDVFLFLKGMLGINSDKLKAMDCSWFLGNVVLLELAFEETEEQGQNLGQGTALAREADDRQVWED